MKISAITLAAALLGGASTTYATDDVNISKKKKMMPSNTMADDEMETYHLRSLQSSGMSVPLEEVGAEEAEPNHFGSGSKWSEWWDKWGDKLLGDKCYTLESRTIPPTQIVPIKTAQNSTTFYGYDNKAPPNNLSSDLSGNTNGALVLLHQDTTTDIVSLIYLAGNAVPTQAAGTGFIVFTGVDAPVLTDDTVPPASGVDPVSYYKAKVSELEKTPLGVLTFEYSFGAQKTDGIVAPITLPLGKCATANLSRFTNVNSLEVDDGTGSNIVVSSSIADEVLAICRSKCEE